MIVFYIQGKCWSNRNELIIILYLMGALQNKEVSFNKKNSVKISLVDEKLNKGIYKNKKYTKFKGCYLIGLRFCANKSAIFTPRF